MYSINYQTGNVTRLSDNKVVAPCQSAEDTDFLAYLAWLAQDNTPTVTTTPDLDTVQYVAAVQSYLDSTAQSRNWDSIYTAALRAAYVGPWQAEGIAFAQWMDACWVTCHQIFDDVAASIRTTPSIEEVISELPAAPTF